MKVEDYSELTPHFALPNFGDAEGAAVQILRYPLSVQREFEERRAQGATQMRAALAPIQAHKSKATPRGASLIYIDAQFLKALYTGARKLARTCVEPSVGAQPVVQ